MKFKPGISTFHVAILFILSCSMVVLAVKLRTLSTGSESAPTLASFETLADQQGELRTELEKLISSNLITLSRYQADQTELRQKIETLANQSATEQARLQLEQELVALAAEAEQIKSQIAQLQKVLEARQAQPTHPIVRKPVARQAQPARPPFAVIGFELRGSEAFLAVAAHHNSSLNEVVLLRQGDAREGWQLTALEAGKAHFIQPDGVRQSIDIR
ncbi:hypothetical protein NJC38_17085 [Pseudomonas sp. 21LCFQ010]|uniref:hypothetical protein n=1 Tax=Pseudomonas sp. 21LCFQ010 TaxID=2957506 RepID=UPI00209733A3|nr:hypothetical protein [Pseudomonas sp. 21LCFQ010]MCO8163870.1 hypothetical protein [Pseudomonas sp. 21LCFQ010]